MLEEFPKLSIFIILLHMAYQDLWTRAVSSRSLCLLATLSFSSLLLSNRDLELIRLNAAVKVLIILLFSIFIVLLEKLRKKAILGGGDLWVWLLLAPSLELKEHLLLIPLACLCTWPYLILLSLYCLQHKRSIFEGKNSFPLLPFYIPALLLLKMSVL